ncbi:MAG: ATP-binding protein, partial [Treponema sp.]|nr:ATP-binding protein [Treponema sp.]
YTIEIHSEFKRKYLLDVLKEKKFDEVIISNNITEKDMFYNENNSKQILDLASILEKERFDEVKTRLKEAGTRSGFVCLFSGCAGTGKTETVFQIARKTGRNIIKIDMSALRSKWWGEDEKNVKAVFTNYKSVLQESRIEPILLLNEADAIIGKRLNIEGHNGAIITAINATQNIILEELENFEGIMIATTNLTKNFDSAFERRFLYKIEFEKPDRENRIKLWKYIAKLDEEKADILTEKFKDFTGAQIENIYRKIITDIVLYGNEIQIEKIIEFCKNETISNDKIIIGFESGK